MGLREPYSRRRSTTAIGVSTSTPTEPKTYSDQDYHNNHSSRQNKGGRTTESSSSSRTTSTSPTTPPFSQKHDHHRNHNVGGMNEWEESVLRAELDLHHALLTGDLYTLDALWEEGCIMVDPYDRYMGKHDALEGHYYGVLPIDHYQILREPDSIKIFPVPGRPDVALVIVNIHFIGDMIPGHFVDEYIQYRRVWRRQPPSHEPTSQSQQQHDAHHHQPQSEHDESWSTAPWWQIMREEASLMVNVFHH